MRVVEERGAGTDAAAAVDAAAATEEEEAAAAAAVEAAMSVLIDVFLFLAPENDRVIARMKWRRPASVEGCSAEGGGRRQLPDVAACPR